MFASKVTDLTVELLAAIIAVVLVVASVGVTIHFQVRSETEREYRVELFRQKLELYRDTIACITRADDDGVIHDHEIEEMRNFARVTALVGKCRPGARAGRLRCRRGAQPQHRARGGTRVVSCRVAGNEERLGRGGRRRKRRRQAAHEELSAGRRGRDSTWALRGGDFVTILEVWILQPSRAGLKLSGQVWTAPRPEPRTSRLPTCGVRAFASTAAGTSSSNSISIGRRARARGTGTCCGTWSRRSPARQGRTRRSSPGTESAADRHANAGPYPRGGQPRIRNLSPGQSLAPHRRLAWTPRTSDT